MRVRMTRRAAVAGLVAVASLPAGAAPAQAAPGDAAAHGAELDLDLPDRDAVTAGPFAAASADGPAEGPSASVDLPGVLETGVITTAASRDDKTGGAHSRAATADVRLDLVQAVTGPISARLVEATCDATQKGVAGGTELVGLDLGRLGALDAEPAPNTALDLDLAGVDVARLVLNEQTRDADGGLTVNAVRLTLLGGALGSPGSGDLVVSAATCGPAGPPIPSASGAGLWPALGLPALVGVPAAAAGLRRRRAPGVV
ncbi:choice-of-anchor P family protein [Actinosynnema sp. NPDC059797]